MFAKRNNVSSYNKRINGKRFRRVKQIEKAASHFLMKTGNKASLKEINQYFKEKAKWSEKADGILFQDLPSSPDLLVLGLNYRKRIQIAVYNKEIIYNFAFHFDMECVN